MNLTAELVVKISNDQKLGLKAPRELLKELAANELNLAACYLAAADSATKQQDENGKQTYLRKAFVTYCQVQFQMSEFPENQRVGAAEELQGVHSRLAAAYFEDE